MRARGSIFVIHFRPPPGVNGVRALKAILKIALRHYGLRALEVREINDPDNSDNVAKWRRKALTEIVRVVLAANDMHSTPATSQEAISHEQ